MPCPPLVLLGMVQNSVEAEALDLPLDLVERHLVLLGGAPLRLEG